MSKDNGGATALPVARTTVSQFEQRAETAIERRGSAAAAEAEHTVKALFTVALAKPRTPVAAEAELLNLCQDYEFADESQYKLPRGNKEVSGLTIRFAEEALRLFRNFHASNVVVAEDERSRTVRVRLMDLEEVRVFESEFIVDKTIERKFLKDGQTSLGKRLNSEGEVVHLVAATEADMYQKTAILVSKALRDNVLRMLPLKFKLACEREIAKAIKAGPQGVTRDEVVRSMAQVFADLGVSVTAIEEYLGHRLSQYTEEERLLLRGLAKSIQEGHTTWGDATEERKAKRPAPAKGTGSLGTMKAGDSANHQGHDESAAATAKAKSGKEPAKAGKEQPAEQHDPIKGSILDPDGSADPVDGRDNGQCSRVTHLFTDEEAKKAIEQDAAERTAKVKADTIAEIETTLDGMGYGPDAAVAFAKNIGLPEVESLEAYDQLALNRVLDGLVKERKTILERDAAREAKDKLVAEIKEARELLKGLPQYATDAKWRSAVEAALIPERFDGNLEACTEAVLGKILAQHKKWMAKVGAARA